MDFYGFVLPGSTALILDFIFAADTIIGTQNLKVCRVLLLGKGLVFYAQEMKYPSVENISYWIEQLHCKLNV